MECDVNLAFNGDKMGNFDDVKTTMEGDFSDPAMNWYLKK